MTNLKEIYKCRICGNIVEVIHPGAGQLVCCGEPMILQQENTVDAALEKHVPVINKKDGGIEVQVGSILHPADESHYIEWVELFVDGKIYKQYLKPGQVPVVFFAVDGEQVFAREYCNLHGLWTSSN